MKLDIVYGMMLQARVNCLSFTPYVGNEASFKAPKVTSLHDIAGCASFGVPKTCLPRGDPYATDLYLVWWPSFVDGI